MRLLVIVPFLNEDRFLERFLDSLARQTRLPDQLLLVDDGSTDRSYAIAAGFAAANAYASALRRPPRPPRRDRLIMAEEFQAFLWALEQADDRWDVVAKLDGDLELTPETIAELTGCLEREGNLGMVGSFLTEPDGAGGTRVRIRPEHVHGATKFYRRRCWEQIAPVDPIIGWDTMDEVKARMHGWRTRSVALPGGDPLHLRPRASYDGRGRGYRRSGAGAYALGGHPIHILLYAARQMGQDAGFLGALNYLLGWSAAALRRQPRAAPEVRAHVRQDELGRIRARVLRLVRPRLA